MLTSPASRHAWAIRTAISPRLAIRTLRTCSSCLHGLRAVQGGVEDVLPGSASADGGAVSGDGAFAAHGEGPGDPLACAVEAGELSPGGVADDGGLVGGRLSDELDPPAVPVAPEVGDGRVGVSGWPVAIPRATAAAWWAAFVQCSTRTFLPSHGLNQRATSPPRTPRARWCAARRRIPLRRCTRHLSLSATPCWGGSPRRRRPCRL